MKFTDRECAKNNNKEDKRNSAFRDTVPALSVYFKGRFNEKMESYTILLRQIFLKNQRSFLTRKEIHKEHAH